MMEFSNDAPALVVFDGVLSFSVFSFFFPLLLTSSLYGSPLMGAEKGRIFRVGEATVGAVGGSEKIDSFSFMKSNSSFLMSWLSSQICIKSFIRRTVLM